MLFYVLLTAFILSTYCVQAQFDKYKQSSGYVDVREGAHLFYWLFYTTAHVKNYTERPLIIWLYGGPGTSSTGLANFNTVGPLTQELTERNETWIKNFNVMFLDSPVGTGFSYVDDSKYLTKTNSEIADDFMVFIKEFYRNNPEFEGIPLYIYGHSYGAKMAVDMGIKLHKAEKAGTIKSNLSVIFMANTWNSPLDHVLTWNQLLNATALVDHKGYKTLEEEVKKVETLFNNGKFFELKYQYNKTLQTVFNVTSGVDIYDVFSGTYTNFLDTQNGVPHDQRNTSFRWGVDPFVTFMNTVVKKALNISENIVWHTDSDDVYGALNEDFMKPVVIGVETLLNETDIILATLNGNYDLLCTTPGQLAWISKLKWPGAKKFQKTARQPIWENNRLEGYSKKYGNFKFYGINGAGHIVPKNNVDGMRAVLRDVTTFG